jgi:hypothetical protein
MTKPSFARRWIVGTSLVAALSLATSAYAWPLGLPFPRPPFLHSGLTARVYVPLPPPLPVVSVRPAPPAPGFVWVSGYHRWDGRGYVWVPGHWSRPPYAHARYSRATWRHDRRGWYFVAGTWR